jgi:hypothetical protein
MPYSIALLVAFSASSILYLISDCSVDEDPQTLILAILPVSFQSLCFSFSILNESFSHFNNAFTSSILSFISHLPHTNIE